MSAPARGGVVLALTFAVVAGAVRPAAAHEQRPGVLALVEIAPGRYAMAWTEPVDSRGEAAGVRVLFPPGCRREDASLACGRAGLRGTIELQGMHARGMQVAVLVRGLDGRTREALLTGEAPRFVLEGRGGGGALALLAWVGAGVEHVASGYDHLAFVLGLLLLVGAARVRRLVATVTAFTVAHSITLALAVFELVRLPRAPVEAVIGASVVLVAREVLRGADTLARRRPWVVAGLFGLVHGLGFAGALAELGLPRDATGRALLGFNVGVELGQLAVVALALGLVHVGGRLPRAARDVGLRAVCYGIGALGAYWLVARTATMVTGG